MAKELARPWILINFLISAVILAPVLGGSGLQVASAWADASGTWTTIKPLNVARGGHTATRLADGTVLVAGGGNGSGNGNGMILDSAEIYRPATGDFRPIDLMANGHQDHTATLLPNGQVLVAGGRMIVQTPVGTGGGATAAAELFVP